MPDELGLDLATLARIYLLANTPRYLYRRFREDPSVQRLARALTATELLSIITEIGARETRDSQSLATAYGALVALTFQPLDSTRAAFNDWGGGRLQWDREIWELYLQEAVPTQVVSLTASLLPTAEMQSSASSSSTLINVDQ
jgi:hypothetical protein